MCVCACVTLLIYLYLFLIPSLYLVSMAMSCSHVIYIYIFKINALLKMPNKKFYTNLSCERVRVPEYKIIVVVVVRWYMNTCIHVTRHMYPTHTDINKEHMIYNINNHTIWMAKHPV